MCIDVDIDAEDASPMDPLLTALGALEPNTLAFEFFLDLISPLTFPASLDFPSDSQ